MSRVRLAVLLVLTLCCWWVSASYVDSIADIDTVTLYLPSNGLGHESLEKAEQRTSQPVPFATWSQLEGQSIASPELGRTRTMSVVTVNGDSTIALPSLPMLLPGSTGCLLDATSCYALFGDFSPIGAAVELADKVYTITGVFDYPSAMLVRQGNTANDADWDRVTLSLAGFPDPSGAAQEFAMRHGLAPYADISSGFWHGLATAFTQLTPLLLLVTILLGGLRYAYLRRQTPVLSGLAVAGTMTAAVIVWLLFGLGFTIPLSLIPSRWSDFEFWSAAFADIKAQWWLLLTLPKELPHALPMRSVLGCAVWGSAAAILYLPCPRLLRNVTESLTNPLGQDR